MRATPAVILSILVLLGALAVGSWLRTSELGTRAMHTDEAIQAHRLGALLDGDGFEYNPKDGHGPGLLYFATPVAWAKGANTYEELDEGTLRLTPALCGIALIAAAALFWRLIGPAGVAAASLLTALSPMHVYYSRYFIMEIPMVLLLALFLFCIWQYFENPKLHWMIAAGLCAGGMHATKETFVISVAALVVAAVVVIVWEERKGRQDARLKIAPLAKHAGIGIAASILLSAALYSVFFTNLTAIGESFSAYLHYLGRAEGSGHEKPFGYYIGLLAWKKTELFTWSELLVLALAAVGIAAAFLRRDLEPRRRVFLRVMALYTIATLLIYSLIAYKTPWSILAFLHAAVLMAGFGFSSLWSRGNALGKAALTLAIGLGCWNLYRQDIIANFKFPAHGDRNPYVYSHTSPRLVSKLVGQFEELRTIKPDLIIQVYHPETGWPLPYYFRSTERAGYYPMVAGDVIADLVVADAAYSEALAPLLGNRYMADRVDLRDGVPLNFYIEKELFFKMVEARPVTQP